MYKGELCTNAINHLKSQRREAFFGSINFKDTINDFSSYLKTNNIGFKQDLYFNGIEGYEHWD